MRKLFSSVSLCLLTFSILIISCEKKVDILQKAQQKYKESRYISYKTDAYYPIPNNNLTNKVTTTTEILYDSLDPVGYQYAWTSLGLDRVYSDGELKLVSHQIDSIRILQPRHFGEGISMTDVVKNNFVRRKWTPIGLIENDWEYVRDSIYDNVHLTNYFRVSRTGENNGIKFVTEHHIFIDDEGRITRFERRNLNDGRPVQSVIFNFYEYVMSNEIEKLKYQLPTDYPIEYGRPNRSKQVKKAVLN